MTAIRRRRNVTPPWAGECVSWRHAIEKHLGVFGLGFADASAFAESAAVIVGDGEGLSAVTSGSVIDDAASFIGADELWGAGGEGDGEGNGRGVAHGRDYGTTGDAQAIAVSLGTMRLQTDCS